MFASARTVLSLLRTSFAVNLSPAGSPETVIFGTETDSTSSASVSSPAVLNTVSAASDVTSLPSMASVMPVSSGAGKKSA